MKARFTDEQIIHCLTAHALHVCEGGFSSLKPSVYGVDCRSHCYIQRLRVLLGDACAMYVAILVLP